jgi:hypothetical protein
MLAAWLAVDLAVDQGAYLANFQQSWRSHFSAVKTTEYGTPSEHVFEWVFLFRNWDTVVPAVAGMIVMISRLRRQLTLLFPLVWLIWSLVVFVNHTPWWSYYYVHLALPLSWCAAIGFTSVVEAGLKLFDARKHLKPHQKSWGAWAPLTGIAIFAAVAVPWMGGRMYLQITTIRGLPRTFASLVMVEVERYKPYTHWLYADDLAFSFHTDIPVPPALAVVSLKRLWSGEITAERVAEEFARYQPELVMLNNKTTSVPFRDLLDRDYRLVYQDNWQQLYVLKTIIARATGQQEAAKLHQ